MKTLSKTTLLSTTAIMMAGLLISPQVNAQSNSWDYDAVLAGNVAKDVSVAGVTDITVTGGNGFVEGNADIYAGDVVNVTGDSGATFAYRDNRANIQSSLNGELNSNMQIVIIDKDGVFFGSDFNADVQGIIASSGDITVGDIMDNGSLTISNVGAGNGITMNGSITVAGAGLAAFVAPYVTNNGIINATLGRVQIGAADTVTVDLYGDGLIELALGGELTDALLENNGDITAEGGIVQMSALAAKNTVDNIVNNTGIIEVDSVSLVDGKIILSGGDHGTVRNAGVVVGGDIDISGERFVQDGFYSYVLSKSGDVDIATSGDVEIRGVSHIITRDGDINIDNGGAFISNVIHTLKAEGAMDNISVRQNAGGSIQNAIDAIDNYGTGTNTVNVGAGTYNESVVADVENLILNGANAGVAGSGVRTAESIIDPNSPAIHVTADNVTVDGFTLTGATQGVLVTNADNARISNNIVTSSSYGVVLNNSSDSIVEYNSITGAIEGIAADQVSELWIYDNDIVDSTLNGIRVSNSSGTDYFTDVDIWKNRISGASGSTGILVENSDYATIGAYINYQYGEFDSIATGNVISGVNDGIVVTDSDNAMVIYNDVNNVIRNGIEVVGSDYSRVQKNVIDGASVGISIDNSADSIIQYNDISNTSEGIHANQAYALWVYDNDVVNSSLNGIRVSDSSGNNYDNDVDVWKNRISGAAGSTGVLVENSNFTTVGGYVNNGYGESDSVSTGNIITGVTNGIVINDTNNAMVIYNTIDNVASSGVAASNANGTSVLRNDISNVPYGVYLQDSANVIIRENSIDETVEGVFANNAHKLWVYNNDITNASLNGIYVRNSNGTNYANDVDIWKNRISGAAGSTGILVENSNFVTIGGYINNQFGESDSLATGNVISGVNDAIVVRDSARTKVLYNTVNNVTGNAIEISGSDYANIMDNIIDGAEIGALLTSSSDALIKGNRITNTAEGIAADQVSELWIYDNDIVDSTLNGIRVSNSSGTDYFTDVDIWKNRISGASGSTGILVENSDYATIGAYINYQYGEFDSIATGNVITGVNDGIVVTDSDNAMVTFSTISDIYGNGVTIDGSNGSTVRRNVISDVGGNGIFAQNVDELNINRNTVTSSYENGVYIAGAYNGYVSLAGNSLTDNGLYSGSAGARFESGDIDISDLGNPNTVTNTTALPAIGLQFDGGNTNINIVDETLGGTIFDGFTPAGSFYVRFEDDSIVNPITSSPVIIDGTNASFDGIIPASTGGILTAPDLNFIEERLYDADDAPVNGRGQIFVGAIATPAAAPTIENIEDLFPSARSSAPQASGASLRIEGLPPVGGLGGAAGLNNLEPAAGEGEGGANPQDLANLEPAAGGNNNGGQNVTCLSDVVGGMSGGSVTYNFGGTFEESLSGESTCSTAGI